ncbi:hypothetical protein GC173_12460 [bacterium]|nr:hypothetical protein [bacterium]
MSGMMIQILIGLLASLALVVTTVIVGSALLRNRRPLIFIIVLLAMGGILGRIAATTRDTAAQQCRMESASSLSGILPDASSNLSAGEIFLRALGWEGGIPSSETPVSPRQRPVDVKPPAYPVA